MNKFPKKLTDLLLAVDRETCVLVEANGNPAAIIKAFDANCRVMSQPQIPIAVTPQLHLLETGAVFRFEIEFRSQRHEPIITLDAFLNPHSLADCELLRLIGLATAFDFYIVNMQIEQIGQKRINWNAKTAADV